MAVGDDADAGKVSLPASTEPPAIGQGPGGRVGTASGSLGAGQAAGSARLPELIPLTTQGSDGRRGSVGRRASGGSAGQAGGSELTFGAMLSGKRSASSQGDAARSRLPPVQDDVAAEVRLLLCWHVTRLRGCNAAYRPGSRWIMLRNALLTYHSASMYASDSQPCVAHT